MVHRLLLPVRVLVRSIRQRGVRATVRRALRSVKSRQAARRLREADRAFDAERRIDTAAWVRTPDLVTDSPNRQFAVRYQPSSAEEFGRLMGMLDVDHRDFVFVDYGSGKGKVLMLAAAYPFKQIVGVEFSPPLVEVARENIATLGADAARIETLVADATEFEPPLEPLVLYFFNPFGLAVLRPVLARIRASLEHQPRPVNIVITAPPELGEAIEEAGFEPVHVERLGWLTRGVFAAPVAG
jgi:predicted RNA methylase